MKNGNTYQKKIASPLRVRNDEMRRHCEALSNLLLTLLMLAMLLASCVKDDTSDCWGEVRVYFTIDNNINPANVDRMHLYVFDDKGRYVGEYRDNNISNFNADYYINCSDLLPAKYRFIAWGGKDERYYSTAPASFVKGQTTFNEALLMLEHPANVVSKPPHHIFHSDLPATVVAAQGIQRFDMPLAQLSNTINIHTVGLPADTDSYTFNIADNNCTYKFDSSFAPHSHGTFTYTAPCTKDDASQLHSTLNVLRLSANRHTPQLQIYNQTTGKVLYPVGTQTGDLIKLIMSAYPQNNFDTTHIYDIVITFSTNFSVTITINGWQVRLQGDELIE
jgi:hypothetical protein